MKVLLCLYIYIIINVGSTYIVGSCYSIFSIVPPCLQLQRRQKIKSVEPQSKLIGRKFFISLAIIRRFKLMFNEKII
jgi:hypothetical protein